MVLHPSPMAFRYVDLGVSLMFCEYCCKISADIASYLALSPHTHEKKTVRTSFGDSLLNGLWSCAVSNEHRTSSAIITPVLRSMVLRTTTESQETSMGGLISYLDIDFLVQETLMLSSHCQNISGIFGHIGILLHSLGLMDLIQNCLDKWNWIRFRLFSSG